MITHQGLRFWRPLALTENRPSIIKSLHLRNESRLEPIQNGIGRECELGLRPRKQLLSLLCRGIESKSPVAAQVSPSPAPQVSSHGSFVDVLVSDLV